MVLFPVKSRKGIFDGIPDCVATISHEKRLLMNALINMNLKDKKEVTKWLPWTDEPLAGTTMQPQSCHVWPGMEVCGCTRAYKPGQLVNGLIYIIKEYNDDLVTLTQHPDYNKDHVEHVKHLESKLEELRPRMYNLVTYLAEKPRSFKEFKAAAGVEDDVEARDLMDLGFHMTKKGKGKNAKEEIVKVDPHYELWARGPDGPEVPPTLPEHIRDPTIRLSWKDFQLQARLTHALPYVYYQGKTVANKTLWLMNVGSRFFTMRHLIMGLGRVQESKRVKIMSPGKENAYIIPVARMAFEAYHKMALETKKQELDAKAILEAAENAINAAEGSEVGEDFDDACSEDSDYGVVANPFVGVEFDD
jgi:hypothetical protein